MNKQVTQYIQTLLDIIQSPITLILLFRFKYTPKGFAFLKLRLTRGYLKRYIRILHRNEKGGRGQGLGMYIKHLILLQLLYDPCAIIHYINEGIFLTG